MERVLSRERGRRGQLAPVQETIGKLEKKVEAGEFYEAQQMYKTLSARYAAAQKYDEALAILESGACLQLKQGEVTCGSELAVLFVETLLKGKIPFSEDKLDCIRKIYRNFPMLSVPQHVEGDDDDMRRLSETLMAAKTRVECCSSFLKAALKWSAEFGANKNGHPEFHSMFAEYIYSESPDMDMPKVSVHFVRGNNPEKFASVLVNFMSKCYPGEDDLAIARAILLYLSLGNLKDANVLLDELSKQLESKQLELPQTELTQFMWFLLQTLERDALPLFRILRQKYKSSTDREAIFEELLDEIAEKFYGVRRRNSGLQGIFGDFFKMMATEG